MYRLNAIHWVQSVTAICVGSLFESFKVVAGFKKEKSTFFFKLLPIKNRFLVQKPKNLNFLKVSKKSVLRLFKNIKNKYIKNNTVATLFISVLRSHFDKIYQNHKNLQIIL